MDEIQRGKGEELAILIVWSGNSQITQEQILAWEDHDLEEWLNLQGYEWSEEFKGWLWSDD